MASICTPPLAPQVVVSRPSSPHLSRLFGLALRSSRSCLFRCRQEILPRRRLALAHYALASSSSIFRVASLQLAPEFLSLTFFSGFCLCILTSQFGASRSAGVLHFFSSPPRTGNRGFLDLNSKPCVVDMTAIYFRFCYFWLPLLPF